jgi:hypothetical protein
MAHIVLIGDSIFDNARYTEQRPDVIAHVRQLLPSGWRATLLAIDGATTDHVPDQLLRIPPDASHLVLSVGGNNALEKSEILHMPANSASEVLEELAGIAQSFEDEYRSVVESCRKRQLPLTLCTIYNGHFLYPDLQRKISVALTIFNDVILRVGIEFGLAMIDLRLVCSSPTDYANSIEPSFAGGAKIARVIVNLILSEQGQNTGARVVIS